MRPGELLPAIVEAKTSGGSGDSKIVRILAGAMKQLKHSRLKPDPKLNNDLISLVKEDPQIFNNPTSIEVYSHACVLKQSQHSILKLGHAEIRMHKNYNILKSGYLTMCICATFRSIVFSGAGINSEARAISHLQGQE